MTVWMWGRWIGMTLLLSGCAAPALEPLNLTVPRQERGSGTLSYDGNVEAARLTPIHAQVKGPVVGLEALPGERVRSGQVLVRIDPSAAQAAIRVNEGLSAASRESLAQLEKQRDRQRLLTPQDSTQRGGPNMAEAQFAAAMAQLDAYAQQGAALRQYAAQHQIQAPGDGVVGQIAVAVGEMVEPGQLVLSTFDPHSLRIKVAVPQLLNARATQGGGLRIELPTQTPDKRWIKPSRVQVLPGPAGAPHTAIWQVDLPAYAGDARPGMPARVWLPQTSEPTPGARLFIPAAAVTQRLNLTLVYVLDASGHPTPRPVTVGPANDPTELEVLGGLGPQEQVVVNPSAAEQRLHR